MSIHINEIDALRRALVDASRGGFFRRRRAARRLARLATRADGRGPRFSPTEARAVIEGLIAGMEGISLRAHATCQRALERIKDQSLKEAVCDRLIEGDIPRLRAIAVQARYAPQDPAHRAAYLFVLGRSQFYEAHDPTGEFLDRFYLGAPSPIRDRILGLARSWGEKPLWHRLITSLLCSRGWVEMSQAEVDAAVEMLTDEAYDPQGEQLEQFYVKAPLPIRDRILGPVCGWGDRRWVRLTTGILRSQGWAEMSGTEMKLLTDEAQDQQGQFLGQLERFYVRAPQTVREAILEQARS